jgi:hypothetical protein
MNVITQLRKQACLVAPLVLLVGQAVSSFAQTILIDFGSDTSFRGLSVHGADSNGNFWNSLQPGLLAPNLKDLANVVTPTQLAWDTPVATDSYNGPAGATSPIPGNPNFSHYYDFLPFTDIDQAALGNMGGALEGAFDFAASPGLGSMDVHGVQTDNKTRFQIQGLDPTLKYDFSFFGSHKYEGDVTTVYSVFKDETYTTLAGSANLNVRDPNDPSLHNRDTIATISNLVPAANTILYVQFVGDTGGLGYLNEMRIVASGVAPGIVGDYNANGVVDAADYVVWRNAGATATLPNDATPGVVDSSDYTTWKANFGKALGPGSGLGAGAAVPEPMSMTLVALGAMGLISLNRRR